jgi:hypothetical protein
MPVDESVLQADGRNVAPAGFEHHRPSPSARLGVGDGRTWLEQIERGAGFVHRACRPRPLQQRHGLEFAFEHGPEIATVIPRGIANAAALGDLVGQMPPNRPTAGSCL